MLLKLFEENPDERKINKIVDILNDGGVIIYPTDTVYGIGCDIYNKKAVEKIARLKRIDPEKANFSFVCSGLSHLSEFTRPINNQIYKLMRSCLPGPYTFILEANSSVPKIMVSRKKTVGIRVPDNAIAIEIVRQLGHPIVSTSILVDDSTSDYFSDPENMYDIFKNMVDCVIDGGIGGNIPSTVIDCTSGYPVVIREGKGAVEFI